MAQVPPRRASPRNGKTISFLTYAAYGSNLHPARLLKRTPTARLLGTACLPDWSLGFCKRSKDASGKCTIRPGSDGVHVAIFELSAADKQVLDEIEGLGNGYSEILLDVPGFGNCFSYVAESSHIDETLRPYDWYRELVLAGARLHGFPDDYVQRLEAVPTTADPDGERAARRWALVEKVITTHC